MNSFKVCVLSMQDVYIRHVNKTKRKTCEKSLMYYEKQTKNTHTFLSTYPQTLKR